MFLRSSYLCPRQHTKRIREKPIAVTLIIWYTVWAPWKMPSIKSRQPSRSLQVSTFDDMIESWLILTEVRYGMTWYGIWLFYDTIWYSMVCCGMVWYDCNPWMGWGDPMELLVCTLRGHTFVSNVTVFSVPAAAVMKNAPWIWMQRGVWWSLVCASYVYILQSSCNFNS